MSAACEGPSSRELCIARPCRAGGCMDDDLQPNLTGSEVSQAMREGGMVHHSLAKGGLRRGGFSKGA